VFNLERGTRESLENRVSAYFHRGDADVAKRDKEQAIADFRKALEIDPSNQLAKIGFDVLGLTP
jgi:tetratricopeptide (TPR) repeat protein